MDGPSNKMREQLERNAKEKHLIRCAELAKQHGMDRLKLYLMIGLPGESDADIDECVKFTTELSKIVPIALGIAPFCAKRNAPFARHRAGLITDARSPSAILYIECMRFAIGCMGIAALGCVFAACGDSSSDTPANADGGASSSSSGSASGSSSGGGDAANDGP